MGPVIATGLVVLAFFLPLAYSFLMTVMSETPDHH